jgi:type I restriction enzyme R subunit
VFTDGRIIVTGKTVRRGKKKRADYLPRYTRDFPLAVVEAKADYKSPESGLGQAKGYAQILRLKFACSIKSKGIVEFDFTQGPERDLDSFSSPADAWQRYQQAVGLGDEQADTPPKASTTASAARSPTKYTKPRTLRRSSPCVPEPWQYKAPDRLLEENQPLRQNLVFCVDQEHAEDIRKELYCDG